jgi:hypothetical protein
MGSLSIWHWLVVIIILIPPALLGLRIARRAGLSRLAGLCIEVPLVGLIILWVWAFKEWPALARSEPKILTGVGGQHG